MKQKDLLQVTQEQLSRTLSFFPRAETKASIILGINTGLLALVASKFEALWCFEYWMLVIFIPLILNSLSIFFLYKSSSPQLDGGDHSLVYFRGISTLKEKDYIQKFSKQSTNDHINDMLAQIWRNSEILKVKYDYLRYSYILLLVSIVPVCITLILFSYE